MDRADYACLTRIVDRSEDGAGGHIQNAVLLAASYAALRLLEHQRVSLADLERAIRAILAGKRSILEGRG